MKKHLLLVWIVLSFATAAEGQFFLTGRVTDAADQTPLVGATVQPNDLKGTATDENGRYRLEVSQGEVVLTFRFVGYETVTKTLIVENQDVTLDVVMEMKASTLNNVVVSGSRYEKNILYEPVSIEVIPPDFLKKNQVTDLSQIIERVPGVQIVDGQANIRGSGFSFGTSSRVIVILDEMPFLAPEASNIPWNFVPIENLENVEVVKGPASVVYGTSGMNGMIKIQTAYPTSEPHTSVRAYSGLYDTPNKAYQKWWSDSTRPFIAGTYLAHRTRIGKKFDLVLGANAHQERSYLKGADEKRYRFNFNTRYRITDRLAMGVNGNVMQFSKGFYGFWKDGDTAILYPSDSLIPDSYFSLTLDPYLTYQTKGGTKHTLRTRYYAVTYLRLNNQPNTTASILYADYQLQRTFKSGWNVLFGGNTQEFNIESPIFPKDSITNLPGSRAGNISGIYTELVKGFFKNRLNWTVGGRWEIFSYEGFRQPGLPVIRTNLSLQATDKDIFRLAFGQGFRIPSLAERFQQRSTDFNILANPSLLPEFGYNAEVGYKRAFDTRLAKGYIDAALFFSEFDNLIEYQFGFYAPDTSIFTILQNKYYGFRAFNVTKSRVAGFELSTFLQGNLTDDWSYRLWGGYTYTYPGDLSIDTSLTNFGTFMGNFFKAWRGYDSTLYAGILKYRNLHNIRCDVELVYKKFTLGFAANYQSWMVNVDGILVGEGFWGEVVEAILKREVFPGLKQFRRDHRNGDWVFDLRLRYDVSKHFNVNFIVNNLTNREYAIRIGKINPIRLYTLQMEVVF